jgi:hypothetical protein
MSSWASNSNAGLPGGWQWREAHWEWRGDDPNSKSWGSWQEHENDNNNNEVKETEWKNEWKEEWKDGCKEAWKEEWKEEWKEDQVDQEGKTKKQWPRAPRRFWVHIFLHPEHEGFDLIPMLIGKKGKNMKKILHETGAKIRIRGRGSKYLEVDGKREAPVPLMVAVTVVEGDAVNFKKAVDMTVVQLLEVTLHYKRFCSQRCLASDWPVFSIGEVSAGEGEMLIKEHIDNYPTFGPTAKQVTPGGVGLHEFKSSEIGLDMEMNRFHVSI